MRPRMSCVARQMIIPMSNFSTAFGSINDAVLEAAAQIGEDVVLWNLEYAISLPFRFLYSSHRVPCFHSSGDSSGTAPEESKSRYTQAAQQNSPILALNHETHGVSFFFRTKWLIHSCWLYRRNERVRPFLDGVVYWHVLMKVLGRTSYQRLSKPLKMQVIDWLRLLNVLVGSPTWRQMHLHFLPWVVRAFFAFDD